MPSRALDFVLSVVAVQSWRLLALPFAHVSGACSATRARHGRRHPNPSAFLAGPAEYSNTQLPVTDEALHWSVVPVELVGRWPRAHRLMFHN
jgi:hypothetical protein